MTLDQLGITSIDLNPVGPAQQLADGSVIAGLSTYSRADGTTGIAADVGLAYADPTSSQIILPPSSAGDAGTPNNEHVTATGPIDSQLNQFVQAMATQSVSNAGLDSITLGGAQGSYDSTPALIASPLHS
jgi:hypothetical protein